MVYANAQNIDITNSESKNKLLVSYADDTAQAYEVFVKEGRYTVSQSYSWVRDQTSRFNLVSYSIDEDKFIPIARQARGNFTLDITIDRLHSIVFSAVQQYPIDISEPDAVFSPSSPTNDNWFDTDSQITVSVPNTKEIEKDRQRLQLTGWSIDGSNMRTVQRTESGMFTVPAIYVSSLHKLEFTYLTQYNLQVVSQYGTVAGGGWYDKESTAKVSVSAPDEFLVRHVFAGWEGYKITDQSATVLVDSPLTITARWATDYSQLIVLGIIPAGVAAFVIIQRKKSQAAGIIQQEVHTAETRQGDTVESKQLEESYTKEISEYVLQRSIEKLDLMRTQGLLDQDRYEQIKARLEKET